MSKQQEILNKIISKGGLIGATAKMYLHEADNADLFVKECKEQCHNQSAKNLWGDELVSEIIHYCENKDYEIIAQETIS